MKIKEIHPSIISGAHPKKRKAEAVVNLDFQKLLGEAGQRLKASGEAGAPLDSGLKIETNPISPTSLSGPGDQENLGWIRSQSLQAVEGTIRVLEKYHEGLSDPETSLRKIEPFIQVLTREVDGLHHLSEKLPPSDPLRKILNETGILSAVEVEKFRRGEYL